MYRLVIPFNTWLSVHFVIPIFENRYSLCWHFITQPDHHSCEYGSTLYFQMKILPFRLQRVTSTILPTTSQKLTWIFKFTYIFLLRSSQIFSVACASIFKDFLIRFMSIVLITQTVAFWVWVWPLSVKTINSFGGQVGDVFLEIDNLLPTIKTKV